MARTLTAVEVGALRRRHRAHVVGARELAHAAIAGAARLTRATTRGIGRATATRRAREAGRALARGGAADLAVATARLAATTRAHRARAALVARTALAAVATAVLHRQRAGARLAEEIAAALRARATRRALERAARATHAVRTTATVLGILARDPGARDGAAGVGLATTTRRARAGITTALLAHVTAHRRGPHVGTERVVARERVDGLVHGGIEATGSVGSLSRAAVRAASGEHEEGSEHEAPGSE